MTTVVVAVRVTAGAAEFALVVTVCVLFKEDRCYWRHGIGVVGVVGNVDSGYPGDGEGKNSKLFVGGM